MDHSLHRCLRTLARHAEWANAEVYDASTQLTRDAYHADTGSGASVHALLNRLLVFMRLMQARIDGYEDGLAAHDGEQHKTFARIRDALVAEDVAIVDRIRHLSEDDLELPVTWTDADGRRHTGSNRDLAVELLLGEAELRGAVRLRLEAAGAVVPDLGFSRFQRVVLSLDERSHPRRGGVRRDTVGR